MLAAVMGGRLPARSGWTRATVNPRLGTWFCAKGDVAASAVVNLSGWSPAAPVAGAFAVKGLDAAKQAEGVELDLLGRIQALDGEGARHRCRGRPARQVDNRTRRHVTLGAKPGARYPARKARCPCPPRPRR